MIKKRGNIIWIRLEITENAGRAAKSNEAISGHVYTRSGTDNHGPAAAMIEKVTTKYIRSGRMDRSGEVLSAEQSLR